MTEVCRCCMHPTKKIFRDDFALVYECINCKTLTIEHLNIDKKETVKDYYSNEFYNQITLENSLLSTRKRQALRILDFISKISKKNLELIDYGCGKGVFLKEAHKLGYKKLIGVESSIKSIDTLKKEFRMIRVKFQNNKIKFKTKIKDLNKSNTRVFIALDVIEHFSKSNLINWLESILEEFSFPRYLVIKVPSRKGVLFKIAYFLAKYKIAKKPLHQLLQIGTYPPHFLYFSKKGLINLFSRLNYKAVYEINDLDYEISSFGSRLNLKGTKNKLVNLIIPIFAFLTKISNSDDSQVIFFQYKN